MRLIDASVVVKWFLVDEINIARAEKLLISISSGQEEAAILDLTIYEVVNIFVNVKNLKEKDIEIYLKTLQATPLKIIRIQKEDQFEIYKTAKKFRISAYDAAYITTSKKLRFQLLTADRKLFEKTKSTGVVKML